MPTTTTTARTRLRAAARSAVKAHELVVTRGRDGRPVIAGERGRIEVRDGRFLAVTDRLWVIPALEQVPGVTRTGSRCEYFTFEFPRSALGTVAAILGCQTRQRDRE